MDREKLPGSIKVLLREVIKRKEIDTGEDITYRQIQDATGISISALVDWVNGRPTRFDDIMLIRLCDFFDCEVSDLLVYVPKAGAEIAAKP